MDRFVEAGKRGEAQLRNANGGNATDKKKKVAEKEKTAATKEGRKPADTHSQPASPEKEGESIDKIVQAVAHILKPLIREAVAEAMQASADKIREEMHVQDTRLGELEERLLTAEEEVQEQRNKMQHMESSLHTAWDKIDDLENRSRRNNLRLVGVPESIKPPDLHRMYDTLKAQSTDHLHDRR